MSEEVTGAPFSDREWSRSVSRGIEQLGQKLDREVERLSGKIDALTTEVTNARLAVATLNERASNTAELEMRVRELEQQVARAKGMAVLMSVGASGVISLVVAIAMRLFFPGKP